MFQSITTVYLIYRNTTLHGIKTNESKRKLKVSTVIVCLNNILIMLSYFQTIFDNQKHLSTKLSEQIVRLQDANSVVASSVSKDENSSHTNVNEILEAVQDLSNELHHAVGFFSLILLFSIKVSTFLGRKNGSEYQNKND